MKVYFFPQKVATGTAYFHWNSKIKIRKNASSDVHRFWRFFMQPNWVGMKGNSTTS